MTRVVELFPGTSETLKEACVIPVENVLRSASEYGFTHITIVGRDRSGELVVLGSHSSDKSLALMARGQAMLALSEDIGFIDEPDEVEG